MKKVTIDSHAIKIANNQIEVSLSQELRDLKVIDAFLNVKVSSLVCPENGVTVNYLIKQIPTSTATGGWNNVDTIKGSFSNELLKINISDELQDSIDKKAAALVLNFQGTSISFVNDLNNCVEIDYLSLSEFQSNGSDKQIELNRAGTATVNLSTGDLSLSTTLTTSDEKVLPISISANYHKNKNDKLPQIGMPEGWQLNVNQFLIKDTENENLLFTYIDERGKNQIIEEKYYYLNDKKEKIFVRRENLTIDLQGNLKYNDKDIKTELESPAGLKLVSSIEGIEGYKLVNYEPEELSETKAQIKQLKKNKKQLIDAIRENKKTLCLYAITKSVTEEQLESQKTSLETNSDELSLQEKIETLRALYLKNIRDFSGLEYAQNYVGKTCSFNDAKIDEILDAYKYLKDETLDPNHTLVTDKNETLVWADLKCIGGIVNSESSSIYSLGFDYNNDGSIKSQQDSINNSLSLFNRKIDKEYILNIVNSQHLPIEGSIVEELAQTGSSFSLAAKDLFNIRLQIESLYNRNAEYQSQIDEIDDELKKYENQQTTFEMQVPVHYLYNENNVIYGFGKTNNENIFRLVLIADAYENMVTFSYKDLSSNRIEKIIDSADKTILFEYENDLLKSITDARDHKVKFGYTGNKLASICFDDEQSCYYYYVNNSFIVLNENGLGAKFTFENSKIIEIDKISFLKSIKNGVIKYRKITNNVEKEVDKLDFANLSDFYKYALPKERLEITYNNLRSTTIKDSKNNKNTYLFDKKGNVRTIYKSSFETEDEKYCLKATNFDYSDNNVRETISSLPYSTNYLEDCCFNKATKTQKAILTSGNVVCGTETIPYNYEIFTKYHSTAVSETNKKKSISMSSSMLALINAQNDVCNHKKYILSGWAQADSAFVITDESPSDFPQYIQNRKFELSATVTYSNGTKETFSKSFDWRNTDWQYCCVPLELEPQLSVSSIACAVNYTGNTGTIHFTDLELTEADWERVEYDAKNRPIVKTNAHSEWTTTYEYDENSSHLIKEITTSENTKKKFTTTYEYTKEGNLLRTTDYNNMVKENVYNAQGVVTKILTYHKDEPTSKFYEEHVLDEKGNTTGEKNGLGEDIISYQYIEDTGILSTQTDENGVKSSYGYSKNGTLLETSTSVDGVENTTNYCYTLDFLTSLKHNNFSINYDYNLEAKVTGVSIGDDEYCKKEYGDHQETTILSTNEEIRQTLDDAGNVLDIYYIPKYTTGQTKPQEKLIVQNIYDIYGNLSFVKEYHYNNLYDANEQGTETVHKIYFDKFGNQNFDETEQHENIVTVDNVYSENHNNIEFSTIKILNNAKTKILETLEYFYDYTDDLDQKLESITLPNKSSQHIVYDKLGRVSQLDSQSLSREFNYLKSGDHTTNLVSKLQFNVDNVNKENLRYFYDSKGNITEIRENNTLLARYQYDALSRITREDNKVLNKTFVFDYDAGGNILNKKIFNFNLAQNLDNEEFTPHKYSYRQSGWKDQLMDYSNEKFVYDEIGNPTTYRNKTLSWSFGRQLDRFDDVTFKYNSNGIRTSKFANGFTTNYYLLGNKIIKQTDASNDFTFYYGADGVTGFHLKNNVIDEDFFYKKNAQNDIIGIYNKDNQLICKYYYDAFGVEYCCYLSNIDEYIDIPDSFEYNDTSNINRFIAFKNPFRYRSYYYDFETKLYYLNSRYYDPELGRFINADDINTLDITQITQNGLNLYAYCLNDPVNNIDENGYFLWWLLLAIIVGAIIGGTSNGIKAYREGARGWGLFGAILGGAIMGGAMGGLLAFGGGVGLGLLSSFTLASGFMLSAGVGITAGWVSYSVETLLRPDKEWNLLDFAKSGISGMLKGVATFGFGFVGGKFGSHDKLLLKPLLKNIETLDYNITYGFAKILLGRKAFLSPLSEFLLKSVVISGLASGIRKIIDLIFNL